MMPQCLTRPCPWCGDRVIVPPAMPLRDLAAHLEVRCGSCRGGVQALTSWSAFAIFVAGLAGGGTQLAVAMRTCNDVAIGDRSGIIALITAVSFTATMLICWWFLVASSAVSAGSRPQPHRP